MVYEGVSGDSNKRGGYQCGGVSDARWGCRFLTNVNKHLSVTQNLLTEKFKLGEVVRQPFKGIKCSYKRCGGSLPPWDC